MIGAILRWLPLSLALHSAALATTLLLPRERVLAPLFVDLTLSPPPTPPGDSSEIRPAPRELAAPARRQRAASGSGSAVRAAARHAPPPTTASAPAPGTTASELPVPASPAAIPPPPPAGAPPPPPSDEPPTAVAPPQSSSPVLATSPSDGSASAPMASPGGGTLPSAAPGAGGGGDATTQTGPAGRDAGDASARGGPGSGAETLALAIPGDDGGLYAGYISLLRRRVQEALTYPSAARRRGMSGTVQLDISVEPTGRIADVHVVRSSSHAMLDAAALDAVRSLRHVPFPPGVRPRPVRVRLPVVFDLR